MYMSRLELRSGPELFRFLEDSRKDMLYSSHQVLWKAFPDDPSASRDFLFRREDQSGTPRFFVVSSREPENNSLFRINTKRYEPQIEAGDRLAFSLVANPVVARKAERKKHSSKHDVWMDAKRSAVESGLEGASVTAACEERARQWLIDRGASYGFSVESVSVESYRQHRLYKRNRGKPIRLSSVEYNGVLTVTACDAFIETLYRGIGRSRSFGCGLLLVRRF